MAEPETLTSYLTQAQIDVLLAAIKPHRVGRDGKGFSHVEAYELRAHLNRLLGFARWSEDVLEQDCVFEDETVVAGKKKWTVCYRSLVRLTVCAPDGTVLATYTEGATGDATNQPSRADAHDLSLKTSASQAFKRCCMNLGDSFGLSLYRKGSMEPLVKVTLVNGQGGAAGDHAGADVQDAAPPTFRQPDPEPTPDVPPAENPPPQPEGASPDESGTPRTGDPHGTFGTNRGRVVASPGEADPAPAKPPRRTADEYRTLLLAATTRAEVIRHMRDLAMDGWADAEVGDGNAEPTTLNALGTARLREVGK